MAEPSPCTPLEAATERRTATAVAWGPSWLNQHQADEDGSGAGIRSIATCRQYIAEPGGRLELGQVLRPRACRLRAQVKPAVGQEPLHHLVQRDVLALLDHPDDEVGMGF
ncbi:hypothetical protein MAXJ12_24167 [Mesorhizobium alhagi CCNWXJ12-2]|uniref:Uncharacterized protein n=1 Tax=Mesorhizobium alhagi CCNWXJ12-2 TaxID=1107882 RepID=H0HXB4_9HYPH|nr:hypothetical protein MAXJ12_24167 [Mesorhizobium alhagi CCNWXJ12-2]